MNPTQTTGLIMEGGAMRGLFTAGVLDVLMANDIRLDAAIGVSAGATFGCNYLTSQPGRALRYCVRFCRDPRFCSIPSLLLTGNMYGAKFCYHTIPNSLDPISNENFHKNGIPFYIVCTDVNSGRAVYHRVSDMLDETELEWVRACASMPLASEIVHVSGYDLLDGGIADSIPLKYFQFKGYRRNVIILTQPQGYQKSPNSLMPAIRHIYWNYPKLIRAMEHRHIVYNKQLEAVAEAEANGEAFVIRPPYALPVKHVSHSAVILQSVYQIGRKTAEDALPQLLEFLREPAKD